MSDLYPTGLDALAAPADDDLVTPWDTTAGKLVQTTVAEFRAVMQSNLGTAALADTGDFDAAGTAAALVAGVATDANTVIAMQMFGR